MGRAGRSSGMVEPASPRQTGPADPGGSGNGPTPPRRWGWWAVGLVVLAACGAILLLWPAPGLEAVLASTLDLLVVLALLLSATALGSAIVLAVGLGGLGRPMAMLLSAALGIGAISLVMLAVGLAGLIGPAHRATFFLVPLGGAAVGVVPLWRLWRRSATPAEPAVQAVSTRWSWSALVLIPTAVVVLAAVNLPPGVVWSGEEGRGYDALEYHLQVPREYYDGGRVRFLAHNVYSAFPENAEMWFLLLMGLVGRPQQAIYLVQVFNVVLAVLAVAGVYLAARPVRQGAGGPSLAALAVAATPMLAAVAVVAYVEPMMMLFMATAMAMVRQYELSADGPAPAHPAGCALVIGLLLGLAAGCKYLALSMFILPLAGGMVVVGGLTRLPADRKLRHAMLAGTGLLVAFGPWLVRNAAQAGGNPVFPLAWELFRGGGWSATDALRWRQAHLPDLAVTERLARGWWRFASHPSLLLPAGFSAEQAMDRASLYGPWLWMLCWPVFLTRNRSRWDWLLLATAAGQLASWLFLSAVPGRFILPVVLPLGLLVGRSLAAVRPALRGGLVVIFLSFAVVSGLQLTDRFLGDTVAPTELGRAAGPGDLRSDLASVGLLFRAGQELFEQCESTPSGFLNHLLAQAEAPAGPGARPMLWLVGECRPFYIRYPVQYSVVFSRDLLAAMLAEHPPAVVRDYLRSVGIRFIYVDWLEIQRLRGTPDRPSYGFPASLNPRTLGSLGRVLTPPEADCWLIDLAPPPASRPAD